MENLARLFMSVGQFDNAAEILIKMADAFPNEYRVPMLQAYLEADRQFKIANELRDYSVTKQYYDLAVRLYNANLKPGMSDPEMQQLDSTIEQLRRENWID